MNSRLAVIVTAGLAALAPFANFASANRSQVYDHGLLVLYSAASAGLALLLLAAIYVLGSREGFARRANALNIAIFFFFTFGLIRSLAAVYFTQNATIITGAFWLAIVAPIIFFCWRAKSQNRISSALLLIAFVMLITPLANWALFTFSGAGKQGPERAQVQETPVFKRKPNIYFLLMDGYARADKIKELSGYDNRPYLDFLKSQGFYIVESATANYPTTWLSVSSTLSMRYIQTEDTPPYKSTAPHYRILNGASEAVRQLRANGYRYVHVANGHPQFNCSEMADLCIGRQNNFDGATISDLEINLLQMTPIYFALSRLAPDILVRPFRGSISQVADLAGDISQVPLTQPFFLYAHIPVPHPPFLRDAQCRPTSTTDVNLRTWVMSGIPAYAEYVQCANSQLKDLLGRIISRDPQAIIVLQGDHGTSFLIDWSKPLKQWSQAGISERLAPLNALRVPADCQASLYQSMSLVNTLRSVYACLEMRKPDYLEDKFYISPDSDNREFGQVLRVKP